MFLVAGCGPGVIAHERLEVFLVLCTRLVVGLG